MKAITLLGTLKKSGRSNTQVLTEFLTEYLAEQQIENEIVRLASHNILPGTSTNLEEEDDWPGIYSKILEADIILFATPIWWNNHSSEIQRIVERLDEVYDGIRKRQVSPLEGKLGGVVITGDSDGAEHVTANLYNFFATLGITIPAYCTLGVLFEGHSKNSEKSKAELIAHYKAEYEAQAQAFSRSLAKTKVEKFR